MNSKSKIALITGATSGIGEASACLLAAAGFDLVLCGRNIQKLEQLKRQLHDQVQVETLAFDVKDRQDVMASISALPKEFQNIDVLINSAGNAHGAEPVDTANLEDWDEMIDANVKGLLYVTKAVLPAMVAKKAGHIVNLGSLAGLETYLNGSVYCATKSAVHTLSDAMRMDLNKHGIKVSCINPGMVETNFSITRFKGDESRATKVYEGVKPLSAQDVAEVILFAVTRPHHVNIAQLLLLPLDQASINVVNRKQSK